MTSVHSDLPADERSERIRVRERRRVRRRRSRLRRWLPRILGALALLAVLLVLDSAYAAFSLSRDLRSTRDTLQRAVDELQSGNVEDAAIEKETQLMHFRRWRHVRVLNLSDLRSSKSPEFIKLYQRLVVGSFG